MLVILMDEQILSPTHVCQNCLLADQSGQPRWRQGKLGCGHAVRKLGDNQPDQYECVMGFRVANIEQSAIADTHARLRLTLKIADANAQVNAKIALEAGEQKLHLSIAQGRRLGYAILKLGKKNN